MPRKILLADDSITIQKVVELTFSDSDFDVVSVGNGEQALRKAREVRPDIALLDVIMPEKNGYEVCHIFKQDPELRRMPVLLLTGTFESFDRERADQVGADGYLTKPFESQMLISKVEELLATAPRQVTPLANAGRMEVVTEGKIMSVEAPAPGTPPAAEPAQEAAPETFEEPPPAPSPETEWPEPEAQEVSFPSRPSAVAPEAKADFQEWSGAGTPAPDAPRAEDDGSEFVPPSFEEEDSGSGPPPADHSSEPRGEEFAAEPAAPEPDAPEPPPRPPQFGEPEHPLAPDTYEQTFDLQEGTETVSLAAAPPPAPTPSTLYTGPEPAQPPSASAPLTQDLVDQIARRVVQQLSEQVIREVAWEVIPDLAELLIKQRIQELEQGAEQHD